MVAIDCRMSVWTVDSVWTNVGMDCRIGMDMSVWTVDCRYGLKLSSLSCQVTEKIFIRMRLAICSCYPGGLHELHVAVHGVRHGYTQLVISVDEKKTSLSLSL